MRLYDNDAYREEFMELVYNLLHSDETNDRANQIIDAFDMAPAMEAEPLLTNDPLTLDELRGDGRKPVWIANVSCINDFKGHWDICSWINEGRILFPCNMETPDLDNYDHDEELGIAGWRAYRRKPEGDEK